MYLSNAFYKRAFKTKIKIVLFVSFKNNPNLYL